MMLMHNKLTSHHIIKKNIRSNIQEQLYTLTLKHLYGKYFVPSYRDILMNNEKI